MIRKKNIKKVCYSLYISIVYVLIKGNLVFAGITEDVANNFTVKYGLGTQFEDAGNKVLGYIQVIGTIAAVAALMIIGIKYMLGSAEDKSEKKETLIYYIIGAILVLCITNILPIIYRISTNLF